MCPWELLQGHTHHYQQCFADTHTRAPRTQVQGAKLSVLIPIILPCTSRGLFPGHIKNTVLVVSQVRKLGDYTHYFTSVPLNGISVNHEANSLLLPENKSICTQPSDYMWEAMCFPLTTQGLRAKVHTRIFV